MNKKMLMFIFPVLIVLLALAVFTTFILLSDPSQQNYQVGQRFGMPMNMRTGMMHGTGSFVSNEYEFLVHMIPHHEEAIFTANILKENTEREEMRQFAEVIISTQSDEVEQMTAWLATWYPDEDHDIDYQPMMRNLEGLKGDELDVAFIEDMIPHHMEAVMMSQQLLFRRLAEHEEVSILARDIRNNQRDEIHMMIGWVSRWNENGPTATTNYGSILMWMGLIALLILIIFTVWLITVLSSGTKLRASSVKSAKELLDIRYANGEISQEEYRNTSKNLEN